MQPRPRAETSRLLFPSVRFCIFTPGDVFGGIGLWNCGLPGSCVVLRLRGCGGSMRFSPVAGGNALPGAEGADERVCVFVAEEIGGLVQLKDRVAEVVAGHLMAGLVQDALEAGAGILKAALKRAGAEMELAGDVFDGRALSGEAL